MAAEMKMTPETALQILATATEPNVKLSRADYVQINAALMILDGVILLSKSVTTAVKGQTS